MAPVPGSFRRPGLRHRGKVVEPSLLLRLVFLLLLGTASLAAGSYDKALPLERRKYMHSGSPVLDDFGF